MRVRLRPWRALLTVLCGTAGIATAQQPAERPFLPREADVNDWQAYYDFGIARLASDSRLALQAFTWASHLRPDRAEPLYARWIAYWSEQGGDRFGQYLRDDEKVMRDPKVHAADSLRSLALDRSPFVHQGLSCFSMTSFRESFATIPSHAGGLRSETPSCPPRSTSSDGWWPQTRTVTGI